LIAYAMGLVNGVIKVTYSVGSHQIVFILRTYEMDPADGSYRWVLPMGPTDGSCEWGHKGII